MAQPNAQIDGQVNYDLERLTGLLRPRLGPNILMTGRGTSAVAYRGPFALATGQASAGLKWDQASIYNVHLGPGELKATMANGVVQIEPLDLAVGQGRVHLAPGCNCAADRVFSLPAGPLAQKIEIDPAMCASMLKFVAPVMAGVSAAKGAFSIDLDGCRIPLSDPAKGDVAGRLTIHTVEIGPGPMTGELATFLGRKAPAKLRQESIVQFRMVDGRVYHQGLELMFPELTIRSKGSVGLTDQTLSILVELPVPPKWLANAPLASQALRNQIIGVPLAGTLAKPQLDKKAMEDLTRQFVQNAAKKRAAKRSERPIGSVVRAASNYNSFRRASGPLSLRERARVRAVGRQDVGYALA